MVIPFSHKSWRTNSTRPPSLPTLTTSSQTLWQFILARSRWFVVSSHSLDSFGQTCNVPYYTPIVVGYGGNDGSLMGMLKSLPQIKGGIFWCFRIRDEPDARN